MPRVRLVHCADVHLDGSVASRHGALRQRVAEAVRESFDRLVGLCIAERVDALLVAGDLLDGTRLSPATANWLAARLERLAAAGVTCVIAAGNHDPGPALRRVLPAGSCVLLDAPEPRHVVLDDARGRPCAHLVGCGHPRHDETADLAAGVAALARALPDDGLPRVALAHTQVVDARGADRHRPYAPTARATLADAPVDYWALGHVHRRQRVLDDPPAWYPGNLQGRQRHEHGPKGALLVELGHGPATVAFHELAGVRFDTLVLDDLAELEHARALLPLLRAARTDGDTECVLHVVLRGACPLTPSLRAPDARDELAAQLAEELDLLGLDLDVRELRAPVDLQRHRGHPHVLGELLGLLDELRDDPAALQALAPEVLASVEPGDADGRRALLTGLLEGLDHAAAELLLREPGP